MPAADANTVARLLREYAQRTALRGGNPYRAKAYSRAADSLAALAIPLNALVAEDRLMDILGLALAPGGAGVQLHAEHQFGRALDHRARPHALGRRHGQEGRRSCRASLDAMPLAEITRWLRQKRRLLARAT